MHEGRLGGTRSTFLVAGASGVLMVANVVLVALPSGWDVAAALAGAVVVLVLGRWRGLAWTQMGLGRGTWRPGVRWGVTAAMTVALCYAAILLLPFGRATSNDLAAPAGDNLWVTTLLLIPLRTVILEELTFRGVLYGLVERCSGTRWALVGTSVAFGCWHLAPAFSLADRTDGAVWLTVLGVFIFTGLAGLVLGDLRRRSGSVIAPAALHWAANSLGLVAASLA
jgi:membrane protease YdiL (CAAX protease family)